MIFRFFEENVALLAKILGIEIAKADVRQDLFINELASQCIELSIRQLEEIFCDVMGIRIFGSSYAKAFEYLVAPNFGGHRADIYPPLRERAQHIVRACKFFGFAIIDEFPSLGVETPHHISHVIRQDTFKTNQATAGNHVRLNFAI